MKRPAQGFDVAVAVTTANGPALVGEFQEVELNISHEPERYQPLNSRSPMWLDGDVEMDGTLKRGFIDAGSLLVSLFGTDEIGPGTSFTSARFVITATFNAPDKGLIGRYSMQGCIFTKLGISASGGKKVVDSNYQFKIESLKEAS
ncbi:hypothetical protein [Tumebacillus flagellatus]|uniref:Uncharacterized protein n=1 Tax=Tumebacillus flagellatus TaxID=1157490 RepID=A0A074LFL5_9BACL|nr:hypothetical protein [Tumebacillus flagellatus]KEO81036.1 hypothetical protein EL26_22925 [Tumebacillus flagellatus]